MSVLSPFSIHPAKHSHLLLAALLLAAVLLCSGAPPAQAASSAFPVYPCIQSNVRFWEDIYGRYTTRQGILHDSYEINRIYSVVELVDPEQPWAKDINNQRIDWEKNRIKTILQSLAAGQPPRTAAELHIAALFPHGRSSDFLAASDNIRVQLGQKDRFMQGVMRSGRYLKAFRRILRSYNLPEVLAYLPHVESSFNPRAGSKAGAYGMWQFTRAAGSDYLTINDVIDERYDPYLATDAAARLLRYNYQVLGSWPLALTAYNYGRVGMLRAVRDKGSYERIFNEYNEGAFKFAARNFYSEFIAAVHVAQWMQRNRITPLAPPDPTHTYRLPAPASVQHLLSVTGLTHSQFAALNPALRPDTLEGRHDVPRGYQVRTLHPLRRPPATVQHKAVPRRPHHQAAEHTYRSTAWQLNKTTMPRRSARIQRR